MPLPATAALFLSAALAAEAGVEQAPAQLIGMIEDESGLPLPGVTLTLTPADGGPTRQIETDVDGRFTFAALPPGEHDLRAERRYFQTKELHGIVLLPGRKTVVKLTLTSISPPREEDHCTTWESPIQLRSMDAEQVLAPCFLLAVPTRGALPTTDPMAPGVASRQGAPDDLAWGYTRAYRLDQGNITDATAGAPALDLAPATPLHHTVRQTSFDPTHAGGLDGSTDLAEVLISNDLHFAQDVRLLPAADSGWGWRSATLASGAIRQDKLWATVAHSATAPSDEEAPAEQFLSADLTAMPSAYHHVKLSARQASPTADAVEPAARGAAGGGQLALGQWDWFFGTGRWVSTQATLYQPTPGLWRATARGQLSTLQVGAREAHSADLGVQYAHDTPTGAEPRTPASRQLGVFLADAYEPVGHIVILTGAPVRPGSACGAGGDAAGRGGRLGAAPGGGVGPLGDRPHRAQGRRMAGAQPRRDAAHPCTG